MVVFVFGSVRSASALPLISLATSAKRRVVGIGIGKRRIQDRIGELAAFLLVKFTYFQEDRRKNILIETGLPGGGTATFFHCSQRAELTKVPSFSAKPAPGKR